MSELKALAQHRWDDILTHFGIDARFLTGKHMACPLCDGGKDRFRYTNMQGYGGYFCSQCGHGDGFDFLASHSGRELSDVIKDVKKMLGHTKMKPEKGVNRGKARLKLRAMWADAKPLSKGCPTHRYLLGRGLAGLEFGSIEDIRCHPGVDYWDKDEEGNAYKLATFPAMIGLIKSKDGEPVSIHVTYLSTDNRKAAVDKPRKIMTPAKESSVGAVRLETIKEGQVLCVAEGIETALSMKLLFPDICPWAVISAGNMEKFIPPNDSSALYIAADNDISYTGQAAAYALAKRLSGKLKASVLMPEKQGTDWNDELNARNSQRAVA